MRKLLLVALALATAGFLRAQDKAVINSAAEQAENLKPIPALPLSEAEARQHLNAHLSASEGTTVLVNNGPLITHPGQGAGGNDASIITTGTLFGTGHSAATFLRVADNFTVPAGEQWQVDSVFFYAYQTGSTTTSTITSVNVRLWRGAPDSAGSQLVFGDTTTNRMIRTRFSGIYRVADSTTNITNTQRPIMVQTVNLGGTTLTAGTYWLDWQTGGSLTSGPWVPPVSIVGQPAVPGANARQRNAAGVWNNALDGTNPIEFPFVLHGTRGGLNPLSPFNLVAPPAGVTVLTSAGNSTPVTISWDTSATGARYNWIFAIDSTDTSPRIVTISSNTNSITRTLGQIDAILASLGLEPGQSQAGFWTVWAYKAQGAPGPDSLRATTWRAITFGRQGITLSPFNLVSPPDNTTLVTLPTNPNTVNVTWTRSGTGAVTYKWFFTAPSLTGSVPTIVRSSNNGGLDTVLTLRVSQIDSILASAGVAVGDSVDGEWRVFAYRSATDSLASTQTFNLRLRRGLGFSYRVEVITQAGYDSLTTGTTVSLTGDDAFTNVPLPIPFQFAEVPQTSINICTNGFANFGTGSTAYTNDLSATTAPFNVIAPFWDDLYFHPTSSVTTDVLGTAPNRVFVIQYNDAGRYPSTSAWRLNFQIRLYETTNIIEFSYGGTTPGTETFTASIGLKGSTGGSGNFVDATTGSTTTANNSIAQFPARGLKYRLIPGPTGFSNTKNLVERPKEFKLEQNYPNPFNPTTTIQFAVPSVSDVKLEVFNILGQKVASLVNRRMEAGVHTVNFNATNLSSGVYFYRLQAGNFVQTKKMMLVK
jgi:hypothetical protein